MWKPGDDTNNMEHVDNYLASIERAKAELAKLNEDIKLAVEQKQNIESGNIDLLHTRLQLVEDELAKSRKLTAEANEIHSKNTIMSEDLQQRHLSISKEEDDLLQKKFTHLAEVKSNENRIKAREDDMRLLSEEIDKKKKELDEKSIKSTEIINQIMDEKKSHQELINISDSKKSEISALLSEHEDKLSKFKEESLRVEELNKSSEAKMVEALQMLEDARILKSRSEDEFQRANQEKSSNIDLIIEAKKAIAENLKSAEFSKNLIAEAKQRITELNLLKESMAK